MRRDTGSPNQGDERSSTQGPRRVLDFTKRDYYAQQARKDYLANLTKRNTIDDSVSSSREIVPPPQRAYTFDTLTGSANELKGLMFASSSGEQLSSPHLGSPEMSSDLQSSRHTLSPNAPAFKPGNRWLGSNDSDVSANTLSNVQPLQRLEKEETTGKKTPEESSEFITSKVKEPTLTQADASISLVTPDQSFTAESERETKTDMKKEMSEMQRKTAFIGTINSNQEKMKIISDFIKKIPISPKYAQDMQSKLDTHSTYISLAQKTDCSLDELTDYKEKSQGLFREAKKSLRSAQELHITKIKENIASINKDIASIKESITTKLEQITQDLSNKKNSMPENIRHGRPSDKRYRTREEQLTAITSDINSNEARIRRACTQYARVYRRKYKKPELRHYPEIDTVEKYKRAEQELSQLITKAKSLVDSHTTTYSLFQKSHNKEAGEPLFNASISKCEELMDSLMHTSSICKSLKKFEEKVSKDFDSYEDMIESIRGKSADDLQSIPQELPGMLSKNGRNILADLQATGNKLKNKRQELTAQKKIHASAQRLLESEITSSSNLSTSNKKSKKGKK